MVGPRGRLRARRLRLTSTLTVALVGLTVVLALIAALGIGRLYAARQDYEDALARTYELESTTSRLLAAAVIEETGFRLIGDGVSEARRRARLAFDAQARQAMMLARGDPRSSRLVEARVAAQQRARRLAQAGGGRQRSARMQLADEIALARTVGIDLTNRQRTRRVQARDAAGEKTRSALVTAIGAGVLALVGAVTLIAALIGSIRRPLDDLVTATQKLAAGDLSERVEPSGPTELRELDSSFNTMAEQLESAQTRIETEREKLAATIESLGDALVVCESDGSVSTVNPRVAQIAPALRPGAPADAPGSPLPRLAEALKGEITVDHRDRTLSITAARLGPGASDGVVWTLRDISERARLERVKSDFVATASHELRSPLTSIKGFVELLAASEGLGAREREFVGVILLSTDRLVDLVNDLLDVARLEARRMEVHPGLFDLSEVVSEVVALMGPRVAGKRQTIDLDLDPSLPRALADPGRVRQIVTNLLSNAHQYTDEGGGITIAAKPDQGRVRLTVSDTGRGMSAEDVKRVFDRFVRRDDGGSGTGLGLSIVRSLVDLQGGAVHVDSVLGEGTTFTVYLPAEPDRGRGNSRREAIRGKRVLVVGRSSVREDLEGALVGLGLDHEWVTSATAAVQACQHRAFHITLVDVGIRRLDVVLRHLDRRGRPLEEAVVLFSVDGGREGAPADAEVIPVEGAAGAVLEILERQARDSVAETPDG